MASIKDVIVGRESLISNSLHNKFIQDYIITNSLKDCESELELIFSDQGHINVSSLAVYLVFPFLGQELNSLEAHVIFLPNHSSQDFIKSLQYCFDIVNSKESDDIETFEDIYLDDNDLEGSDGNDLEGSDDNDMEIEVKNILREEADTVLESELVTKTFAVDEENLANIQDISFRCEKCNSDLNQDTLISHICDNINCEKEEVINDHEVVLDEQLEKPDLVEVIIEYDDCDSSQETSNQKSFPMKNLSPKKKDDDPETITYVCDACGKSFDNRSAMLLHISQGSSTCVGKLKKAYSYMKHTVQQRQNYLNDYDDQELPCSYCDKSFRHRAPLIQHQRTHTKEKPFRCDKCGRTFSAKGNLKIHMEKHKDITERKYKCKVCDFGATSSVLLKYHMNGHKGVKMFQCQDCGASYMRPHSLRKHKRVGCNQDQLTLIPTQSQTQLNDRINTNQLYLVPNIIIKRNDEKALKEDVYIHTAPVINRVGKHEVEDLVDDLVEEEMVEDDDLNLLVVPVVHHLDIHSQVVQEEIITL